MRKRLPPLFTLQAFEAAARHGNFSLAASELNLTQSAVSRQVKQLEEWCGHALFDRHGPRIDINAQGRALLERLNAPLHALHEAVYANMAEQQSHLHINTLASIADSLLLPALASFQANHAAIQVHLQADYQLHSLPPQTAMVALRYVTQPQVELVSHRLLDDYLLVVGAPALVASLEQDASKWPPQHLLRHSYMDWSAWTSDAEVTEELKQGLDAQGLEVNDALLLLRAAEQGLGLCLTRLSLAREALQQGRLGLASPHLVLSPFAYYLEYRHDSAELDAIVAFRDWIKLQAQDWKQQQTELLAQLRKTSA